MNINILVTWPMFTNCQAVEMNINQDGDPYGYMMLSGTATQQTFSGPGPITRYLVILRGISNPVTGALTQVP